MVNDLFYLRYNIVKCILFFFGIYNNVLWIRKVYVKVDKIVLLVDKFYNLLDS